MTREAENNPEQQNVGKPYFSAASDCSALVFKSGTKIGRYTVCRCLGEGGYGLVYLAKQQMPIQRQVALKVIKPGMDTKQVLARFEAERQTLALLDHPHIAHIHDAGAIETGQPFFVMEFIDGLSITSYCDRHQLDIPCRLKLFMQVLDAVEYAHQCGIIHRDLKPSNILVSGQNGNPLAKVIDFGVARAIDRPPTEQTLYTDQSQLLGTPEYMSPEQADRRLDLMDTRADIYSLGVVLYELLTGVLPFEPQTLRDSGLDGMRKIIRDEEPQRPSTRLSSLGEKAKTIAVRRDMECSRLVKKLRRELEWIPLKAMRKERTRRYRSASEFSDDIKYYLAGRPLIAGPETLSYQMNKLVQRHRQLIMGALSFILVLFVALIVSISLYFREGKARAAEEYHRTEAEKATVKAEDAQQVAEHRLADFYREQGRRYLEAEDFDRALILLAESIRIDKLDYHTWLLMQESLRKHPDPSLHVGANLIPWEGNPLTETNRFATSPDREFVVFVDTSGSRVNVFNTQTGRLSTQLQVDGVQRFTFVPGNQYAVIETNTTGTRKTLLVFDLSSGERITSFSRAKPDVDLLMSCPSGQTPSRSILKKNYETVIVDPDGAWFAFLDCDMSRSDPNSWVSLWDFSTKKLHTTVKYDFDHLLCGLMFRQRSAYNHPPALCAVDRQGYVNTWDTSSLLYDGGFVWHAVDATVRNERMLVIDRDGTGVLHDRHRNRPLLEISPIVSHVFSPDQSKLLTATTHATGDGIDQINETYQWRLWDTRRGEKIADQSEYRATNGHFSPDGNLLIIEQANEMVSVFQTRDGTPVLSIPARPEQVVADISSDSQWLITTNSEEADQTEFWDLATGGSYAPYDVGPDDQDIEYGWIKEDSDRAFRSSTRRPRNLPRFNADCSSLICKQGLMPLRPKPHDISQLVNMVASKIPLRVDQGLIRSASPTERLTANLVYHKSLDMKRSPDVVQCYLALIALHLKHSRLELASSFLAELLLLQPYGGPTLSAEVEELTKHLCNTYVQRGLAEERSGRYVEAVKDYEKAMRLNPDNNLVLTRLAWQLTTSPNQSLRQSTRAVELAELACELTGWRDYESLSTFATACAADDRFEDAIRLQQQAIDLMPTDKYQRWEENYQERLFVFQSNRPYSSEDFWNVSGGDLLAWLTLEDLDNHGSIGSSTTFSLEGGSRVVGGSFGSVVQLNGPDSHVRITLPGRDGSSETITVAVWMKFEDPPTKSRHLANEDGHAWSFSFAGETQTVRFRCPGLDMPSSPIDCTVVGKTPLDDSQWHHIVGVYDGRRLYLYLDGILDNSVEASGQLSLGRRAMTWGGWSGFLHDLRVYSTALDENSIREMHRANCDPITSSIFVDALVQSVSISAGKSVELDGRIHFQEAQGSAEGTRVEWRVIRGPGRVEFSPSFTVAEPSVRFSKEGIYEIAFAAFEGSQTASKQLTVLVHPPEFNGLLVRYDFNSGNGQDGSGHDAHGQLMGDAHIVDDPDRGLVLDLDGDGDYFDCQMDQWLQAVDGLTVSAWVQARSLDRPWQTIVGRGAKSWHLSWFRDTNGVVMSCYGLKNAGLWENVVGDISIDDGKWHHVCGVFDGENLVLSIDGKRQMKTLNKTCALYGSSAPVWIGSNSEEPDRYWNGLIDDVQIYNRALSVKEISDLFESTP